MSVYSTRTITREEAVKLVWACRNKRQSNLCELSNKQLEEELDGYVYSEKFTEELGILNNFSVVDK